ncbi:MAG: response regulator [Nitrososphaeraceae archaeon]
MRIASDYDMKNFKNIPNSRKVMIIEDEEDLLILYKDYLRKNGCEVMATSTTAEEILLDYKSYRPDFLIMDYKLPGSKNGLQAAKEIFVADPRAKIIILTAFDEVKQEMKRDKYFEGKDIKIIIKPIQMSQLKILVTE